MKSLYHPFRVTTRTSRRPDPELYDILRKWAELDEKFIQLASQSELTDVNMQLDKSYQFYVTNQISRTISQIMGQTDKGFAAIAATLEGALHVYLTGGYLLPSTRGQAVINIATATTHDIIAAVADLSHYITSLVFTVAGEVNVTLRDETGALTGPMDFGGTDEPRGMTHSDPLCPIKCHAGEKFQITLSAAVQVSGIVTYYDAP